MDWHTRSAPSASTRRLLLEQGGFLYDSDADCDGLPFFTVVAGRRHLVLPYSFDTNAMHFHQGSQRCATVELFAEYVIDAYDQLWQKGVDTPRVLSVGQHLRDRDGAWFARRDAVARHRIARFPENAPFRK